MKRSLIKPIAFAVLVAVTPTMSGCFGSFGATRFVWELNKDLFSNKILQWVIFLVFATFQVYSIAATIDVFLLNLIEFWTGSNPLVERGEDVPERVVQLDDDTLVVMNRDAADRMSFEFIRNGDAKTFELQIEKTGAVLTEGNETIGLLHASEDGISIYDGEGQILDAVENAEQQEAVAAYEREGAGGLVDWHEDRGTVSWGIATR